MRMRATVPPSGPPRPLTDSKRGERKYPHARVFAGAWGNVLMPQLIRLTLTVPQGKSFHICNGQIIMLPQMFVSFFFCTFVPDSFHAFGRSSLLLGGVDGHRFSVFLGLCGKHGWMPSSGSQGQALHLSGLRCFVLVMPGMVLR